MHARLATFCRPQLDQFDPAMHFVRWINEVRSKSGVGDADATALVRKLLAQAEASAAKPVNVPRKPLDLSRCVRGEVDKKSGVQAAHVALKKALAKGTPAYDDAIRDAKWEIRKDTHDHLRAVSRELVGRLRSLRYFQAVRDQQRKAGGERARAGEAILSCCGHVGELKLMQHHANLQVRSAPAWPRLGARRRAQARRRAGWLPCRGAPARWAAACPAADTRPLPQPPRPPAPPRTGVPRRGLQGARAALVRRRVRVPRRRLGRAGRKRRAHAGERAQGRRRQGGGRAPAVRLEAAPARRDDPRAAARRALPRLRSVR